MTTIDDATAPDTTAADPTDGLPVLYVCHGDDEGPRIHPCRKVHEALREAGIDYRAVVAAHGSPVPFLRRGSRDDLERATGSRKLPAMVLPDGRVLVHSKAILGWIAGQG